MTRAGKVADVIARVPSGLGLQLRDALQRCFKTCSSGALARGGDSLVGSGRSRRRRGRGRGRGGDGDGRRRRWRASRPDVRMRAVPGGFLGDDDDGEICDADGDEDGEKGGPRANASRTGWVTSRRTSVRQLALRARSRVARGSRASGERSPDAADRSGRRRRRRRRDRRGSGRRRRPGGCHRATGAAVVARAPDVRARRRTRRVHPRNEPREAHGIAAGADAAPSPAASRAEGRRRKLDLAAASPSTDFTAWPEFHNGAAAGLALAASAQGRAHPRVDRVQPTSRTVARARRRLDGPGADRSPPEADKHGPLQVPGAGARRDDAGGSRRRRRRQTGQHEPGREQDVLPAPPHQAPARVSRGWPRPTVQAAALLSVGLLYEGTAHRLMSEILLAEIGRDPGGDGAAHGREGYALAAGLALGLVTLGRGRAAVGLADLQIPERLRRFLGGGSEPGGERRPRREVADVPAARRRGRR